MSALNFNRKTKPTGSLKNRKFFVSQIDTSNLAETTGTWNLPPSQSATHSNALLQNNLSPLLKSNLNGRTGRHFVPNPKVEVSNSPTKFNSTRNFSTNYPIESLRENIIKAGYLKGEKPSKLAIPVSPSTREIRKNPIFLTGDSIETDSNYQEPRIEILDIALSPQMRKKVHGPKQEKILKLLQSYVPNVSGNKKGGNPLQNIAVANSMVIDSTNDLQQVNMSHMKKRSSMQEVEWEDMEKPVPAEVVLNEYGSYLSPYEKEEIQDYPEIYFISDSQHKKFAQSVEEFDDERGDYTIVQGDHIKYQYEVIEMLGRGSFGQVIKVFDHKTKEYLALKIVRSLKKFQDQAKIEIKILEYMTQNQGSDYNIADLKHHFKFRKHTCFIFELMSLNLYDFLKKNKFRGLHLSIIRKFAIQVLYALKFMNRHKIIHCDLKPENILLKHPTRTGIRVIDFGSSCFENEKLYTYIQSRFYRAPEVILGLNYTTQIDMWSFGCLLCELYSGYPIFAGETEQDQLLAMMEVLGVPDLHFLAKSPRKRTFFEENLKPKLVPNSKGRIRTPNTVPLASILECEDKKFVDLIQKCLVFEPKKRFTPDDALSHPWILEDLPKELKSQHMKLIGKIDKKPSVSIPGHPKRTQDSFSLKDKTTDSPKGKGLIRRSSQPRFTEENSLTEASQSEVPVALTVTQEYGGLPKQGFVSPQNSSFSNKGIRKDLRYGGSQGSLVANSSIYLNGSAQSTLRNKTSNSRDNLFSAISPQSPKISSRNELVSAKSNQRSRYKDKLKRVTSTEKLGGGTTSAIFKENSQITDYGSKENNPREDENALGKASSLDKKQFSVYKSWNFSKGGLENKQNGEMKKSNSKKNIVSLNLKSPHQGKVG